MTIRSLIIGSGSYLPKKQVTNDDLSKTMDTSNDWIIERTGILSRHVAEDGEFTSDLGVKAASEAIKAAGLKPSDIDGIILGTSTPDNTFPSTAVRIQSKLGINGGLAFDVQAACSGFVFALTTADNFIKQGMAKNMLVVGAETMSRILDWNDRTTAVLFGDGAGAVVLRSENGGNRGILGNVLRTDGTGYDSLYVDGGAGSTKTTGVIKMNGREVFKHAVTRLGEVVGEVLDVCNMTQNEIDWLVPHQANKRIIDATAKKLELPEERVVYSGATHANTSAASIPLALDSAIKDGRIKQNQVVLFEAFAGGYAWGANLVRM